MYLDLRGVCGGGNFGGSTLSYRKVDTCSWKKICVEYPRIFCVSSIHIFNVYVDQIVKESLMGSEL